MKLLTLQDLNVEDSLALYFDGTFDPLMEIERAMELFLHALEEHAGEWMPDVVECKRRRKDCSLTQLYRVAERHRG